MKFLCICAGGNVRSAALAYALRHECRGHEAIAVGYMTSSPSTINLLCEWADRIVVMEAHMQSAVDSKFHAKTRCLEVGPDIWGVSIKPDLLDKIRNGIGSIL